jgi:hypothetical protein
MILYLHAIRFDILQHDNIVFRVKYIHETDFIKEEDKMSYLIKDTTEEERRKIVEESLGNLSGACDGCSQRVADMYDAYIRGEMELKDINMAFSTRYVKGAMEREPRSSCPM